MGKDVRCSVWLPPANAEPNTNVADVALHEVGQSMHFLQLGLICVGQLCDFLLNFRRRVPSALGKVCIPESHVAPSFKTLDGFSVIAWRKKSNSQSRGHGPPR